MTHHAVGISEPLYIMKFLVLALIQIRRDLVLKAGDSSAAGTKLPGLLMFLVCLVGMVCELLED